MSAPAPRAGLADRRIARWLALAVFLAGALVAFDANDGNTDAEVHFQQVRAMARHGTWAHVPDDPVAAIVIELARRGRGDAASQEGLDGRVYGHFGAAYVLAGLPFFGAGAAAAALAPSIEATVRDTPFLLGRVGAMREYLPRLAETGVSPFFLGIAAASIYLASRRLGAGRAAALLAALAYPFATFAGPTARHAGSDTMAAGLLALALERVLAAREEGRRAFFAAGIAAGLLAGSRYLAFAVMPGVALAAVVVAFRRSPRPRDRALDLAAAAAPLAALTAAVLALNALRWGSPLDFGYRNSFADNILAENLFLQAGRGLLLALLAPSRGLLFFAFPLVVLGAAGGARLFGRDRALAAAFLVGLLTTAVPPSLSPVAWHGTWSWGPRYHLSCLVFLAPLAALALDAALARGGPARAGALAAVALGALATFPALVSSPLGFLSAAIESLRIERPARSFADPAYRDNEPLAEANRQESLVMAPPWSPYHAIRGQWRWLLWGALGREEIPIRAFFGADSDAVVRPQLLEHGGLRSTWWLAMRARTGSAAPLGAAAILGVLLLLAVGGLRRAASAAILPDPIRVTR